MDPPLSHQHHRRHSYKTGVDATEEREKRIDAGASIRKNKRAQNLERRRLRRQRDQRRVVVAAPGEGHSMGDGDVGGFVFDKRAFLQTQDYDRFLAALRGLEAFLAHEETSDEMIDARFTELFCCPTGPGGTLEPAVLTRLLDLCDTNDTRMRDAVDAALSCLINVTGAELQHTSLRIATHLLNCGLSRMVIGHIGAVHAAVTRGQGHPAPLITPSLMRQIWKLVLNVIYEADESRDAVLATPLFAHEQQQQQQQQQQPPPFFRELERLYHDNTAPAERELLFPAMLRLVCGAIEVGGDGSGGGGARSYPPWSFTYLAWPFVLRTFAAIPVSRQDQMGPAMYQCLEYVLGVFGKVYAFQSAPDQPEHVGWGILSTLLDVNLELQIAKLRALFYVCNAVNKERIAKIMVSIGRIVVDDVRFQHAAVAEGWVETMTIALQCQNAFVRRHAAAWFANLATEGLSYVARILDDNSGRGAIFRIILNALQCDTNAPVRKSALFCILACFETLTTERAEALRRQQDCIKGGNGGGSSSSSNNNAASFTRIMQNCDVKARKMVCEHAIFKCVAPYIDVPGAERMTMDILELAHAALTWNAAMCAPLIEECGLAEKIQKLVFVEHARISDCAARTAYLLDAVTEKADDMDVCVASDAAAAAVDGMMLFGAGGGPVTMPQRSQPFSF